MVVTGLLDTSILIDVLRKYPPALAWLTRSLNIGVSQVVWLEVLDGVQNKPDQQLALRLLKSFDVVELEQGDVHWALERLIAFRLSHNVGVMDCLIASVSYRLQVPLFTSNLKHFTPLLGALAQKAY